MKIGQLDQHCGNCKIIDYCAEPFSDLCLCTIAELAEMQESEYKKIAEKYRYLSNKKIADRICRDIRKGRSGTDEGITNII